MKIMTMHLWSGRDTLKSRLLKHTLFLSSGMVITSFFAYLFRITCAQTMPIEDYGKLALFLTIYVNLIIIAHLNLGTSMTKYVSEYMVKNVARIPSLYLSALTIAIVSS
jgi:O-antigen/teichoic acid export membrane protein